MTAAAPDDDDPVAPAAPPEPPDLGFGRLVSQKVRGRFLSRDGVPTSHKYGLGGQYAERFYLNALNARWPQFLLWLVGAVLLTNGVFALAYAALGPGALHGVDEMGLTDPFMRAFGFSVAIFTLRAPARCTPWGRRPTGCRSSSRCSAR